MLEPRKAVQKMAPYSPPTGGRAGKLRLDFNENTVGCSPAVIEAIRKYATADALTVYPEYVEAMEELAAFFGVTAKQLLMTNGTDEAIQVMINTYVDDGDEVLVLHPSYAMYKFYSELAGGTVREVGYRKETLAFPFEEMLAAITPATRAILIANPNNPTGTGVTIPQIHKLLIAAPQAAVLIDEAYFEFSGVTVLPKMANHPNLFVSRTFSKVYGMAAMRCGCLFSSEENVAWMHKAQSPYSVNALAAVAARAAVRDKETVANFANEVKANRAYAYERFRSLGVKTFPSEANFILFYVGARAVEIRDALRAKDVLVRDRSYEIDGCVRVTIGTRAQVDRFFQEFDSLWK